MGVNVKLLAVVAGAIVLFGGGVFFLNRNKSQPQKMTPQVVSPAPAQTSNSLLDLLSLGKTQKCDFTYQATDGAKISGTVYLTGTKMRSDIETVTNANKKTNISMLRDGDTTYVWGSSLPSGIKMTLKSSDLKTNAQANQYFNTTQKTDYKCSGWSADAAKFVVPTDIKFMDMGSLMMPSGVPTTTTSGSTNPASCAVCSGLTGDNKTSCMTIYHCQ